MQAMRWMCVQVRSVASRYDFAPFITQNIRMYTLLDFGLVKQPLKVRVVLGY
jgi:hypothetical protein